MADGPLFDSGSDSREPFIVYSMADGSLIFGEYEFTTDIDGWWDDREEEVRLIKRTYRLIAEEEIVLPDPYPIEDDEDESDSTGVSRHA